MVQMFFVSVLDVGCFDSYGDVIELPARVNCVEHVEFSRATMRVACKLNQKIKRRCCKTCQQIESVG